MKYKMALTAVMFLSSVVQAQPRGGRGAMEARFQRNSPPLGKLLPDISAYDENGKKFKLRSLRGHYTVLVFGCLT